MYHAGNKGYNTVPISLTFYLNQHHLYLSTIDKIFLIYAVGFFDFSIELGKSMFNVYMPNTFIFDSETGLDTQGCLFR